MALGILIAIFFGINEEIFKGKINEGLSNNQSIQSIADTDERTKKLKYEADKNWRYYQRYHFHATGVGAMTLATLLFIAFLNAPKKERIITQYILTVGGFLYPFVWLFAAIFGPELGRTEAKEAFQFLGYAGGLSLFGMLQTCVMGLRYSLKSTFESSEG